MRCTISNADGTRFGFDNYYLTPETHVAVFDRAGFLGFRWIDVSSQPSEASPFWDEFMANPPITAFEAARR